MTNKIKENKLIEFIETKEISGLFLILTIAILTIVFEQEIFSIDNIFGLIVFGWILNYLILETIISIIKELKK